MSYDLKQINKQPNIQKHIVHVIIRILPGKKADNIKMHFVLVTNIKHLYSISMLQNIPTVHSIHSDLVYNTWHTD